MTGNKDLRDFLRKRSATLLARAAEADFFKHGPTKGTSREALLQEALREILPGRFGIQSGEIKDSTGACSPQCDVVIYDQLNTPKLQDFGGSAIFPVETVYAMVSVKSSVDSAAIKDASAAAVKLRSMERRVGATTGGFFRTTDEPYPAVYLFGYRGMKLETIAQSMQNEIEEQGTTAALNGICVLGSGIALPVQSEKLSPGILGMDGFKCLLAEHGSYGLFVGLLYHMLCMAPENAPDLLSYIDLARMSGLVPE